MEFYRSHVLHMSAYITEGFSRRVEEDPDVSLLAVVQELLDIEKYAEGSWEHFCYRTWYKRFTKVEESETEHESKHVLFLKRGLATSNETTSKKPRLGALPPNRVVSDKPLREGRADHLESIRAHKDLDWDYREISREVVLKDVGIAIPWKIFHDLYPYQRDGVKRFLRLYIGVDRLSRDEAKIGGILADEM